jgi:uncharacterized protein (UPF0333 family)
MNTKISFKFLFTLVLVLFFIVLINFLGVNSEQFVETDNINSNIIILNRIIESCNSKQNKEEKKFQTLTSFIL